MAAPTTTPVPDTGAVIALHDNGRSGLILEHFSGAVTSINFIDDAEVAKGITLSADKPNYEVPSEFTKHRIHAICDTGLSSVINTVEV